MREKNSENIRKWFVSKIPDTTSQAGSSNASIVTNTNASSNVNETIASSNIATIASSDTNNDTGSQAGNNAISTSNNTDITSFTLTCNDSIVTNNTTSTTATNNDTGSQAGSNAISTSNNTDFTSFTLTCNDSIVTNTTTSTTATAPAIDNDSRSDSEGDGLFVPKNNKSRWTLDDLPSYNAKTNGVEVHNRNEVHNKMNILKVIATA